MRIARDIITCMAKPLARSLARSLSRSLTHSLWMGRLDGPLVFCPLLDPSRSPSSPVGGVWSWMPATAATKLLNTFEPNRNAIRESRFNRARLPPSLPASLSHDGLMGLKSERENPSGDKN